MLNKKRLVTAFAITFSTVIKRLNSCFRNIVYYVEYFCDTGKLVNGADIRHVIVKNIHVSHSLHKNIFAGCRVQLKHKGVGGEVKGKLANGVGSQYSHTTSKHGVSSITTVYAHISTASIQLN